VLFPYIAWLAAMGVLILCSGFFSSSEAALFLLTAQQRRDMVAGSSAQRTAARLLDDPDRLLTAVLFWNLVINVTYFAMASIASIRLEASGRTELAGLFAVAALVTIIFFSEMLPKSVAVLQPRKLATWVAMPLALAVRLVDPVIPVLRTTNLLSRRLIWPRFAPEPYLEVSDLERAVELSTTDAALLKHEKTVLQNIVLLSSIHAEELMRPRMQFLSFNPPVSLSDLEGQAPPSGYVLVTEEDSDEIAGAIPMRAVANVPPENLDRYAEQIVYVPWCTSAAHAMDQMRQDARRVAAVVNEFGETVGILTFDDILDTIFSATASRSERLFHRSPIEMVGHQRWRVTGMTALRRLAKAFDVQLPASKSVTVAGIVQEVLGRVPQPGDICQWGRFWFEVLELPERGQMVVQLTIVEQSEDMA
jgi:CBS domain containing-hemolysin-like protein